MSDFYDLKKEQDVQLYLKNMEIEYGYQCYEDCKPEGCMRLGTFYMSMLKNYKHAIKAWKKGCYELKNDHSCDSLAKLLVRGIGFTKRQPSEALKLFSRSCDNNFTKSCLSAASLYKIKKDWVNYEIYLNKGCKSDLNACMELSAFIFQNFQNINLKNIIEINLNKPSVQTDSTIENVILNDADELNFKKFLNACDVSCKTGSFKSCQSLSNLYKVNVYNLKNEKLLIKNNKLGEIYHSKSIKLYKSGKHGDLSLVCD
ncbi:Beta-lactamase hcp-like protein [Intoshia linei]|uniref:Beta-lactamase hcp-like protein n=1 Tax=Intoshia linei TaxID=1819745 RepID=A0A177AR35_9BILA|nr:Beta-lactamase hcp-like protein [Intoshia linei]